MRHGEIWLVDFAPQVGQEIDKQRPAIIVNHDSIGTLQLKAVVLMTDGLRNSKEWQVKINPTLENGIHKESVADCFQIKSISKARFIKRLGKLSSETMLEIKLALIKVLDLI